MIDWTILDTVLASNSYRLAQIPPNIPNYRYFKGFCIVFENHEGQKGVASRPTMRITGKVSSGLGRAHVFMAQKHYQDQFQTLMGTSVWPVLGYINSGVCDARIMFVAFNEL